MGKHWKGVSCFVSIGALLLFIGDIVDKNQMEFKEEVIPPEVYQGLEQAKNGELVDGPIEYRWNNENNQGAQ